MSFTKLGGTILYPNKLTMSELIHTKALSIGNGELIDR